MKKLRKIVKVGNSFDIRLNPIDLQDLDWKEGDLIDISEAVNVSRKAK